MVGLRCANPTYSSEVQQSGQREMALGRTQALLSPPLAGTCVRTT